MVTNEAVRLDGETIDPADAAAKVKRLIDADTALGVILRVAPEVRADRVLNLADGLRKAGVGDIRLKTLGED